MAQKEYEMVFKLAAQLGGNFNGTFSKAQATLGRMQTKLQGINKLQSNISAYHKQQKAVDDTRRKLETLQKQYDNIQKEMSETEGYSSSLNNKLLQKELQIEKTSEALDNHEAKLKSTTSALKEAGVDTGNLTNENRRLEGEYQSLKAEQEKVADEFIESADSADEFGDSGVSSVGAIKEALATAGIAVMLKKIYDGFEVCAGASIQFESGMVGVDKTTNLTKQELAEMSDTVKVLSTEIPVTTTELTEVGETAGQLGIAKENLVEFTTVMSELGTATTMTANDGATMLAQFANITQMDPSYYENLGSTVVALGNECATTEQKITEMSQGIAASGSLANMSEADIMGVSAAVTSLGIEAGLGSTAVSKLITMGKWALRPHRQARTSKKWLMWQELLHFLLRLYPGVNIIMDVAAGVGVLTGVIAAAASSANEAKTEYDGLTAASQRNFTISFRNSTQSMKEHADYTVKTHMKHGSYRSILLSLPKNMKIQSNQLRNLIQRYSHLVTVFQKPLKSMMKQ